MSKNTSVSLGPHFDSFISERVRDGRFESASEVVRAGLRLLKKRETRLAALRKALIDGEQSGRADYSLQGVIDQLDREEDSH